MAHPGGERHPRAKLSDAEVEEIRQLARAGSMTQRQIAEQYSVGQGWVSMVLAGKRRTRR